MILWLKQKQNNMKKKCNCRLDDELAFFRTMTGYRPKKNGESKLIDTIKVTCISLLGKILYIILGIILFPLIIVNIGYNKLVYGKTVLTIPSKRLYEQMERDVNKMEEKNEKQNIQNKD